MNRTYYDRAKQAIASAKQDGAAFLVYYNRYTRTRTLKVVYCDLTRKNRRANDSLHARLMQLAKSTGSASRGHIYSFDLRRAS